MMLLYYLNNRDCLIPHSGFVLVRTNLSDNFSFRYRYNLIIIICIFSIRKEKNNRTCKRRITMSCLF